MAKARLLVLGSTNTDMTVRLPRLPAPGETVLGGTLLTGPGGKGANQAVAAVRAGAEVVFVTAVGDDAFGREALANFRREGIRVDHVKAKPSTPSGVALIFVGEAGENMIGVAPGANEAIAPEDVDTLPDHLFGPDALLLIAGLEVPLETVARAVRRAGRAGMPVVLNPAPAHDGVLPLELYPGLTVITPNRGELAALTGKNVESREDLVDAAWGLTSAGVAAVVVTLGREGCLILNADGPRWVASHSVLAVDTVGAGDAFSANLAVALAEGRTLTYASEWATAAAALAVTRHGAQAALPYRDDVERILRPTHH